MAQTQHGQVVRDDSNFPVGFNYLHLLSGTGATLIKATPGFLNTVTFNSPTATSVVTLYDSTTTGTLTGTIAVITVPASPMPVSVRYNLATNNGLVVTVGTAGSDLTITYV